MKLPENEIVPQVYGSTELSLSRNPEAVLAEAKLVAKAITRVIEQTKAFTVIGGKKHMHFTALQTMGSMFRLTPRIKSDRFVEYGDAQGWEAEAEVLHIPSGQIVGGAFSTCLNDEDNWSLRPVYGYENGQRVEIGERPTPLFQLRSMAQTRAAAKALRLLLSWIMVLAGYEAQAAEEMGDKPAQSGGQPPVGEPQRKSQQQGNGGHQETISEPQQKRLYAIAKGTGKSDDEIKSILKSLGFNSSREIPKSRYEAVCNLVQNGGKQEQPAAAMAQGNLEDVPY